MIQSTSSSDRILRPDTLTTPQAKTPVLRLGADRFALQDTASLREAVAALPAVRPEVVARGRELAADPNYPSAAILRQVGAAILRAPEFTDDES